METITSVSASPVLAADARHFAKNELIYFAGGNGQAWQVVSGVIRLDRFIDDGPHFSGLALPGDIIGIEAPMLGCYVDEAHALTPCELAPWRSVASCSDGQTWLAQLALHQRRVAEILNLRRGPVEDRMHRLLGLLCVRDGQGGSLYLPSLRHIAEIIDSTVESSSRVLSSWRRKGWLGERKQGKVDLYLPLWPMQRAA